MNGAFNQEKPESISPKQPWNTAASPTYQKTQWSPERPRSLLLSSMGTVLEQRGISRQHEVYDVADGQAGSETDPKRQKLRSEFRFRVYACHDFQQIGPLTMKIPKRHFQRLKEWLNHNGQPTLQVNDMENHQLREMLLGLSKHLVQNAAEDGLAILSHRCHYLAVAGSQWDGILDALLKQLEFYVPEGEEITTQDRMERLGEFERRMGRINQSVFGVLYGMQDVLNSEVDRNFVKGFIEVLRVHSSEPSRRSKFLFILKGPPGPLQECFGDSESFAVRGTDCQVFCRGLKFLRH